MGDAFASPTLSRVYWGEVFIVISLSILFDYGQESLKDKMRETGRRGLIRIIDQVFQEITILGQRTAPCRDNVMFPFCSLFWYSKKKY